MTYSGRGRRAGTEGDLLEDAESMPGVTYGVFKLFEARAVSEVSEVLHRKDALVTGGPRTNSRSGCHGGYHYRPTRQRVAVVRGVRVRSAAQSRLGWRPITLWLFSTARATSPLI